MAGQRTLEIGRLRLLMGVCLAALTLTLVGAAPALAAPKTLHAAAYEQMKDYMQQYDKEGFAKVVDLGSTVAYRKKLASLKIVVDPKLKAVATYDPVAHALTFSQDPRKEKSRALGQTVWHEVTHAFEDQHGDIGVFDSAAYAERNIDYMTLVADSALMQLERMELNAKNGATAETLRANWQNYLKQMETAAKLNPDYPPDFALLKSWFGFDVNADSIKKMYLTDKAFAGDQWKNLREALAGPDWSGKWTTDWSWPTLVLQVSGSTVAGTWLSPDPRETWESLKGTLSQDGKTLTATWKATRVGYDPTFMWNCSFTMEVVTSADNGTWHGSYTSDSVRTDGQYPQSVTQPITATRAE